MMAVACLKVNSDLRITIAAEYQHYSILIDGQAKNPGLPSLRECISHSYGQARWRHDLPGMAVDPSFDEWSKGVRTPPIPLKHRGISISTNRQGPPHTISLIQAGSAAARNGNNFVGDTTTHTDAVPSSTMSHAAAELHQALLGLEYTRISVGVTEPGGVSQTVSFLGSPPKNPQISWARAL